MITPPRKVPKRFPQWQGRMRRWLGLNLLARRVVALEGLDLAASLARLNRRVLALEGWTEGADGKMRAPAGDQPDDHPAPDHDDRAFRVYGREMG